MMKIFILNMTSMIMMLLILFILSKNYLHPTFLIILMIFYTLMICMNMSIWSFNFMYSIILFLIMISGMLIIFLYFSSLISNEQNKLTINKYMIISFLMNIFMMFYFLMKYNNYNYIKYLSMDTFSLNKINSMLFKNISLIYMYPYNNFSLMCMLYLLISLFTIIKICSIKSSSLRKLN